jgi:hypothetical protein
MSFNWRVIELGRTVYSEGVAAIVAAANMQPAEAFHYELARQFMKERLGEVPHWLDVGLAEYFSQIETAGAKRVLGGPTWRLKTIMQERRNRPAQDTFHLLSLAALFTDSGSRTEDWHLSAWALVHYLANGAADHADRFRRFLRAVAERGAPRDALVQEYGPLPQLEAAYRAHARSFQQPNWLQWVIPIEPPSADSGKAQVEEFEDASFHILMAELQPANAARELELALAHKASQLDQRGGAAKRR